ncbi:MAG: hypothetical protein ABS76_16285 [Pelagibacterium sp. SCN 64-44]|nr:MAG: hypothetical protein ABS76_16285 [Pelagibacterium sp. SCN 64-44]
MGIPNERVVAVVFSRHNLLMKTATQLRNRFRKRLRGPLGPTPTAFAIRHCLDLIVDLRQCGASWTQIAHPINVALQLESRAAISADTLRGIVARERRAARPEHTLKPRVKQASAAGVPPADRATGRTNPMKGESEISGDGSLDQAAGIAAVLEQMKGI